MIIPMVMKIAGLMNFFMADSLQQDERLHSLASEVKLLSAKAYPRGPQFT